MCAFITSTDIDIYDECNDIYNNLISEIENLKSIIEEKNEIITKKDIEIKYKQESYDVIYNTYYANIKASLEIDRKNEEYVKYKNELDDLKRKYNDLEKTFNKTKEYHLNLIEYYKTNRIIKYIHTSNMN